MSDRGQSHQHTFDLYNDPTENDQHQQCTRTIREVIQEHPHAWVNSSRFANATLIQMAIEHDALEEALERAAEFAAEIDDDELPDLIAAMRSQLCVFGADSDLVLEVVGLILARDPELEAAHVYAVELVRPLIGNEDVVESLLALQSSAQWSVQMLDEWLSSRLGISLASPVFDNIREELTADDAG